MPEDAFSLVVLGSVDSTNNYAMQKVHAGMAKHGDGYFAHEQTQGKGQRGKSWHTANSKNIILTIVLEPSAAKLLQPFHLSVAVALACYDLFKKYTGPDASENTKIKWPNDIYWGDRKAGGILIENVLRGNEWKWAVAGIGININQDEFSQEIKNPVSLKQLTQQEFDVISLATELQELVMQRAKEPFLKLLEEYNVHLYKRNEKAALRYKNALISTTIKGVAEDGLLVCFSDKEQRFDFGEIEWII
jgi:BirA family transcriptional regulator, biotin operon repressor / biotin---[acetyl-CoA-carboxylase] ligase